MALRRNLSPNPSLATTTLGNATDWTSSPSGYARQTGVSGMDRTTGFGGSGAKDVITSPRFAAVAGSQYMASVQVKTGASNTFKVLINWYTGVASGTFINNTATTAFTVNGTTRCEIGPFTAPVGAGAGYLRIIELDSTTVTLAAVLVEQTLASGNTYFDGGTTGASWEGVTGNSTSALLTGADTITFSDSGVKVDVAPGPVGADSAGVSEAASGVASGTVNQDVAWSDAGLIMSLTYDPRRGRNRISVVGLPASAIRAEVSVRPAGRSAWSPVRGGKVALTAGKFQRVVDDYEFAAGVANTYRVRALSSQENTADVLVSSASAVLPAVLDEVWLKFIAQPAFNRRVQLTDWGEITRSSRTALYDVQGRSDPIAVTDVHSSRRVTVTLRTSTFDDGEVLDQALSQGVALFLHVPVTVALPSLYAVAGDYTSSRLSKLTQVRFWQVPLTEVSAPPPSVVASGVSWQTILDSYGSWEDILGAFPTWSDVIDGNSVPGFVLATPPAVITPPPTSLVYRTGPSLLLNGSAYRAVGANVYDLLDSTTSEATQRLTELASFGVNTVRTWAFSNDGTAGSAMLTRLDAALAAAGSLGIRLLLTLGNHYSDWGGPDKFGWTQATWYGQLDTVWMAQITALITRYVGNPNVFAWEILNEPRPNNDTTSMAWLGRVATAIKAIDRTHLVSSGSEGFVPTYYPRSGAHDGASPDINLTALNSGADIDIASAHLYSKYLTSDYSPDTAKTLAAITAQKAAAAALGKPLIVGEAGFDPADFGGNSARRQFISDVAAAMSSQDLAGGFIWNWGRPPASSFTLSPGDLESETVLAGWVATLTGGTAPTILTPQIGSGANDTYHSFDGTSTHTFNNTGNDVAVGRFDATQVALGAALRFTGITIPRGASIAAATLQLVSSGSDSGSTVNSKIRGVAGDNAAIPANDAAFHAPGYTTAVVNWDSIPSWTNGTAYTSPDIKSIIQEIVNRPGWVSGNAIVLTWDDLDLRSTQSGAVVRRGQSYNNTPANAPKLLIRYT